MKKVESSSILAECRTEWLFLLLFFVSKLGSRPIKFYIFRIKLIDFLSWVFIHPPILTTTCLVPRSSKMTACFGYD